MAELGTAYVQILPSMRGMSASISRQLGAGADAASSSMGSRIKSGLGGAFKAVGGLAVGVMSAAAGTIAANMGAAVSRVDTLNNFPRQMKNMGFSAQEAAKAIKDLDNGTKGLPTSLDSIVASAQQFIALPMFSSMEDATKTTLALNNAFLAAGASAADTSRGTQQIAQMFAKGKPDLMSWRTVMETMPAQLSQVSKEMLGTGASSMDLYEALQSGKISMTDFKDALIRMNEKGGAGFASFAQQAKDATKGIKTSLTNMRTSIVRNLANFLDKTGLSDQIIAFATKASAAIDKIGKLVTSAFSGLGGSDLGGAFAGLAPVVGGLMGMLGPLAAQIPLIGGAFAGLTGPVGLAIGLIVGMISASAPLRKSLMGLLESLAPLGTMVMQLGQAVGEFLGPALKFLGDLLAPLVDWIGTGLGLMLKMIQPAITWISGILRALGALLQGDFSQAWEIMKDTVTKVIANIKDYVSSVFNLIGQIIGNVLSFIGGLVSSAWEGIKSVFWGSITAIVGFVTGLPGMIVSGLSSLGSLIVGVAQSAWGMFRGAVSSGISAVVGLVKSLPRRALSALGNLGHYLFNSGKALLTGFKNGIMSVFSGIGNAVKSGLSKIRNLFPFSPAKEGPFSGKGWVLYSGMAIGNAMAEGIERSAGLAVGSARSLARRTQAALSLAAAPSLAAGATGRLGQAGGTASSVSNHFDIRSDNPELVARMVAERLYRRAA